MASRWPTYRSVPASTGEPGHVRLAIAVQPGKLSLDARLAQRPEGIGLAVNLKAKRIPLHQTRFYVPRVGWSDLRGQLDAALKYHREPTPRDELRGTVALNGMEIRVPGADDPALAWRSLTDNPFLSAFASIPVSPNVAAHSIIAVEGDGPVETGDDGVVTYQSAHIPEATSELVVRSGHSAQSHPDTVDEVRRILLLHLAAR